MVELEVETGIEDEFRQFPDLDEALIGVAVVGIEAEHLLGAGHDLRPRVDLAEGAQIVVGERHVLDRTEIGARGFLGGVDDGRQGGGSRQKQAEAKDGWLAEQLAPRRGEHPDQRRPDEDQGLAARVLRLEEDAGEEDRCEPQGRTIKNCRDAGKGRPADEAAKLVAQRAPLVPDEHEDEYSGRSNDAEGVRRGLEEARREATRIHLDQSQYIDRVLRDEAGGEFHHPEQCEERRRGADCCHERDAACREGEGAQHQAGDEAGDLGQEQRRHRRHDDDREHPLRADEQQADGQHVEQLADLAVVDAEAVRAGIGIIAARVEGQHREDEEGDQQRQRGHTGSPVEAH